MEERNNYSVIISDEALRMLESHAAFLGHVSIDAAKKFTADFAKAAASLSEFPELGSWLNQPYIPYRKYRKLLFGRRYLIIYMTKDSNVYIDYVVDTRQDYMWMIEE